MIKKRFYIDTKNTIWTRTYIQVTAETEQEMQQKIDNFDFNDTTSYIELNCEHLIDTCEDLPLEENQYNPTMELFKYPDEDEDYQKVKDNLKDIDKKDVKMFSINDISNLWNACYDEHFIEQNEDFYKTLLNEIR